MREYSNKGENLNFLTIIILSFCAESFQYCDLIFPKPIDQFSSKFSLQTNSGREKFNDVRSYIPGKTYDITVVVSDRTKKQRWNIEELFVKVNQVPTDVENSKQTEYRDVGKLLFNFTGGSRLEQCIDKFQVKFFYNMPEAVTFYWIAPQNSLGCITLSVISNLRSLQKDTVLEENSHSICDQSVAVQGKMQGDQSDASVCSVKNTPPSAKLCNIGSTAIYRMIIENNWNHLNHWKDWPGREGYVPKLTQYIGATHSTKFNIYHLGGIATPAVQQMCTNGSYSTLQKILYASGNDILTVILARSLEATPASSKRSALLVVNSTYHLISFLSHLVPSPDWCTGLSRYDLCSGKCNWPEKVTVSLYPWDSGVFSGESYLSTREVETRSPICPITSKWPKDNPFTQIDGKLQNIGTVTFKLIQEYNKDQNNFCNPDNTLLHDEGYTDELQLKPPKYSFQKSVEEKTRHCQLSEWAGWSKCSATCGKGEKVRYRTLIKGKVENCIRLPMKEVENCGNKCPTRSKLENCQLRLWTEWSPCNATCTRLGISFRERVFIDEEEKQACLLYPDMRKLETCRQASTRCSPANVCHEYVNNGEMCEWSDASIRYFFDLTSGSCKSFTYKGCFGGLNNFLTKQDCESMCNKYRKKAVQYQTMTPDDNENRCNAPMMWGQDCRGKSPSYNWYFDKINQKCFQFYFAGCRGSANKFRTKTECDEVCLSRATLPSYATTSQPRICDYTTWSDWTMCSEDCPQTRTRVRSPKSLTDTCNDALRQIETCPFSLSCSTQRIKNHDVLTKCVYSSWTTWSVCSVACGKGIRERVRSKLSHNCIPEFPQFSHRETCYNDCQM